MHSPKAKNTGRRDGSPVLSGSFEFVSLTKPLNRSSPRHLLQRQGSDPTTARLRASESPSRRRGSGSSTGSVSGQGPPEEDGIRLNPSLIGISLSSLLAIDLWLSKRLSVCACEDSSWGSVRPVMKLIEVSGHGIPWLAGAAYSLYKSDTAAGQEVMLNLLMASYRCLALTRLRVCSLAPEIF
ncbi:Phospholipid phosphatase 6 [Crenichthys baileyi]|uniref:Phospholipid phosphatase 6 n=1 Tax=Crenichthys baileyi TaxID=28760 RepID=A0AAV9S152_9TELE